MKRSIWHSDYQRLRQALKQIRLDAGLTQVELANKLEKPQSFIAKYENGDRNLDFLEVMNVCIACNHSPIEFVENFFSNKNEH